MYERYVEQGKCKEIVPYCFYVPWVFSKTVDRQWKDIIDIDILQRKFEKKDTRGFHKIN